MGVSAHPQQPVCYIKPAPAKAIPRKRGERLAPPPTPATLTPSGLVLPPGYILIKEVELARLTQLAEVVPEKDEAGNRKKWPKESDHNFALRTHRLSGFHDMRSQEVCEYVRQVRAPELPLEQIISAQRQTNLVNLRHEMMYILRAAGQMSLPDIGHNMGGRDHTTVLHGAKNWERKILAGLVPAPVFDRELAATVRLGWLRRNNPAEYARVVGSIIVPASLTVEVAGDADPR